MRRYSYFILQDVKAEHLEGPGSNGITVQIHVESVSGMLWNMHAGHRFLSMGTTVTVLRRFRQFPRPVRSGF